MAEYRSRSWVARERFCFAILFFSFFRSSMTSTFLSGGMRTGAELPNTASSGWCQICAKSKSPGRKPSDPHWLGGGLFQEHPFHRGQMLRLLQHVPASDHAALPLCRSAPRGLVRVPLEQKIGHEDLTLVGGLFQ